MKSTSSERFPSNFLWGAATSAHQVEGNNIHSDTWLVERVKPTLYRDPSGDACNSFHLWPTDLDMVKSLGLNTYRFTVEWARIEPEPGKFSIQMLDHYRAMLQGCCERGLRPVVTFCHFSIPRWFAAIGGWSNPEAPNLFARYCERVSQHMGAYIAYAVTLNEPNLINILPRLLTADQIATIKEMNSAAGAASGSSKFKAGLLVEPEDVPAFQQNMLAAHAAGRSAIKAARSSVPVGVALSISDDQEGSPKNIRSAIRSLFYGPWLELAKSDDFIGVQNYTRLIWGETAKIAPPEGAKFSQLGTEIYAPSLAGAVKYAHEAAGVPVLITEHGLCTHDDDQRQQFIRESLSGLASVIAKGVPVIGYIHWTLVDNFEWIFGYGHQYGLCSIDWRTFERTPRQSAHVLGEIAKKNGT